MLRDKISIILLLAFAILLLGIDFAINKSSKKNKDKDK